MRPYAPRNIARDMQTSLKTPEQPVETEGPPTFFEEIFSEKEVPLDPSRRKAKKKRKARTKLTLISGTELLDLKAEIEAHYKVVPNLAHAARQLKKSYTLVRALYIVGRFTPEVQTLIKEGNLTLKEVFALQERRRGSGLASEDTAQLTPEPNPAPEDAVTIQSGAHSIAPSPAPVQDQSAEEPVSDDSRVNDARSGPYRVRRINLLGGSMRRRFPARSC